MNYKLVIIFISIILLNSCGKKTTERSLDFDLESKTEKNETIKFYKVDLNVSTNLGLDSLKCITDNQNSSRKVHAIINRDIKYYDTRGVSCGLQWSNYYVDFNKYTEFDSIMMAMYNSEFDTCLISNYLCIKGIGREFYHLHIINKMDAYESLRDVNKSALFNLSFLINRSSRRKNYYEDRRLKKLAKDINIEEFISKINPKYRELYTKELSAIFK